MEKEKLGQNLAQSKRSPLTGEGWVRVIGSMAKDRITKARALRSNQTEAEKRLWYHLRDSTEFAGKFRRQVPIDIYIVDFACLARRLIIEVDGGQHRPDVDAVRQRHLETQGFKVIRFWNNDVLRNTEGVLTRIRAALDE